LYPGRVEGGSSRGSEDGAGRGNDGPFGIMNFMTHAVPVVDLENVQIEALRAGIEELGAVRVINHGVAGEDLGRRMARLLGRPRPEKARLASPHPYRGWRQWPLVPGALQVFSGDAAGAVVRRAAADPSRSWCGITSRTGWRTTWPPTAGRSRSRTGGTARRPARPPRGERPALARRLSEANRGRVIANSRINTTRLHLAIAIAVVSGLPAVTCG
jgi:hypothetical protein